jgi:hypothetical protein
LGSWASSASLITHLSSALAFLNASSNSRLAALNWSVRDAIPSCSLAWAVASAFPTLKYPNFGPYLKNRR